MTKSAARRKRWVARWGSSLHDSRRPGTDHQSPFMATMTLQRCNESESESNAITVARPSRRVRGATSPSVAARASVARHDARSQLNSLAVGGAGAGLRT